MVHTETAKAAKGAVGKKRVAIYSRVSTDDQTTANQVRELRAVAERQGWEVVAEFTDQGISGAKGREGRPGLDSLLKAAMGRQFDLIAVWSVDRLGRSLAHLVSFLGDIESKRVGLYLHQQQLDTTTPSGKALFQMAGVFAEFERSMIVERVRAGMARAKAAGKHLGRPRTPRDRLEKALELRKAGYGIIRAAREAKIGTETLVKLEREAAKAD